MYIIVNRIGDSITGSLNGESFGVMFTPERYSAMKNLEAKQHSVQTTAELQELIEQFRPFTKETYKELVEFKTPYIKVNGATGQYFLRIKEDNGVETVSKEPLPQAFVDRITQAVEMGIDILPLVKAWTRFLRNPFYSAEKAKRFANYINTTYTNPQLVQKLMQESGVSAEVATERATTYQTPITQEGLIGTYKVSAELGHKFVLDADGKPKRVPIKDAEIDPISGLVTYKDPDFVEQRLFYPAVMGLDGGDAFYSGDDLGHLIRVGKRHRLADWSQVDTNDNHFGVKGLHCGNLDYIRAFQSEGTVTHNVFVDPAMIGAFTDDGTGALRVLEYFVHSSFAGVNKSIYHSSTYAKMTDEAFEAYLKEAIQMYESEVAESTDKFNELKATL